MSIAKPAGLTAVGVMLLAGIGPAGALNLPFGFGQDRPVAAEGVPTEQPVRMAQASDAGQRVMQLEEENRRLNGKVEELSFQVLQMQEQMRKAQEDNEFRFQELEGGGARPAGAGKKRTDAGDAATTTEPPAQSASATDDAPASGDQIGALLDKNADGASAAAPRSATPPVDNSATVASIKTKNSGELYGLAYNYLLAGDYQLAESSFRQYTQTYPDAKDVPDARYWLGESQYQQANYTDAAETFLNAQKDYPKSAKAPEMMLKLGMSLAKLDNRDTACVTFREVPRRYPQMSASVKRKLQSETQAAKC